MKALAASLAFALTISMPLRAEDAWTEQRTQPDEGTPGGHFGSAASLDGALALIGASGEDSSHGSAYFFAKGDAGWTELQRITPDDPSASEFGYRTLLHGDIAIVTADSSSPNGNAAQGSAYVFAPDDEGTWSQTQILLADDGGLFDSFGSAVSLDGDTLVIGAHGATVGENAAQGAAYIFTNDGGTWTQSGKVVADDGIAFDNLGMATALVGDTLFVGASAAKVGDNFGQGAVYAYHFDGATWTQTQKLLADDGAGGDSFGISLAFDGTTLLVGATGSATVGAVYAFTNDGGDWVQRQRFSVDGLNAFANFGNAIALHDGTALVGCDIETVDGFTSRGAAYLFGFDGTNWVEGHRFISSDGTTDDFFGLALDYDGTTALISTLHPDNDMGAAYFYTNDTVFADGFDG
ncbi:MAG TPA: hypothetical protein VJ696_11360 [Rhodanobacteraceae bacterium]|nr:hypothetical protein [Rhodanobacteraceae bacterium]